MSAKYKIAQEELLSTKAALLQEKEESLAHYLKFIASATVHQKKAKGITWHPLTIKETGYGTGDFPYVIVERTKQLGTEHQFSSGKPVELFLLNQQKEEEHLQGIINYIQRDTMKITFNCDDLPYWLHSGSIGVNLLFDEKSFNEMDRALDLLINSENPELHQLVLKILGHQDLAPTKEIHYENKTLNRSQNTAIQQLLGSSDVSIIHGPPGTGKTTTLVEGIKALNKQEKQLLVCAPSNAATDLLTEKLHDAGLKVVRIGNIARVVEKVVEHTADHLLSHHARSKEIKKLKKQATEYRKLANKYKRNFGKSEREQRKMLLQEAKHSSREATKMEDYLLDDILDNTDVITCTLVGSTNRLVRDRVFSTVIIDEAAQALEPASWIPITKAQKVILAGDPLQLPPTVRSEQAKKMGIETTLIEKCLQRLTNVSLLNTQYRMNETIMGFSNVQFYANALIADDSVKYHTLSLDDTIALEFIDTAGCSFDEEQHEETTSLLNKGEADVLNKHLHHLLEIHSSTFSVGIISPYKAQVTYLQDLFSEELVIGHDISINTIDSFQGQERDVIYISLVRSNDKSEIGFLKDFRRMNVAMTRAKKKLVIIGDSVTLGTTKFYSDFLDYVEKNEAYHTAWEWL